MKLLVIKADGSVVRVQIMWDRFAEGYCFVNLTKGHVCSCRFPSIELAMEDLEQRVTQGSVRSYWGWSDES